MDMKKRSNSRKALIKDLELQIDFLVGYRPTGTHWKMEYHVRKTMIEATLADEAAPQEVVDKINRIQDTLYALYQKEHHKQGYLRYTPQDYVQREYQHPPIKVTQWSGGKREVYYL